MPLERRNGAVEPEWNHGAGQEGFPAGGILPLCHRLAVTTEIAAGHRVLVGIGRENTEAELWDEEDLVGRLHQCVPLALPADGGVFVDHRPGATYGHVYEAGTGPAPPTGTCTSRVPARATWTGPSGGRARPDSWTW
ncbi:hypothetical protein [Kitasatospora sp. NPDC057223]|uniref:hypothetical protein n=1 Tax=Kitasatospora sp. NPDC057223 TaxID=3346055 RepID=UPI00363ED538